ncbi:TonB family protein [Novosphingobium resinovorum]|uniref:energy transducer TonB family protein n=1 Tax=Novosphingobium resinovorum TaxID=158500 RepID=UPI002ED003A8|nr:TonB family protein [Novosphingobium resinovorum]
MASWMGWLQPGQGWRASTFSRVDLNAMAASIGAHALVAALLAMTWTEATLVEGGTRASLVSIDLSMREGGPGPRPQPSATPERPQERASAKPVEAPSQVAMAEPQARPSPQPVPSPAAQAGGGGAGRTGDGTAASTTRAMPVARLIPAQAVVAPAAASGPQSRMAENAAETPARGSGGSGGGRTDQAGNSAVGNFNGRVYQHLQRYRRGNTIGAGAVLVGFTVEPNGAARAIHVARGSGSSRFDAEALQLVRRAAPFPRPPDGAAHSFTFEITGQ